MHPCTAPARTAARGRPSVVVAFVNRRQAKAGLHSTVVLVGCSATPSLHSVSIGGSGGEGEVDGAGAVCEVCWGAEERWLPPVRAFLRRLQSGETAAAAACCR